MGFNIGSLQQEGNSQKNKDLREFLREKEIDAVAMQETNVHWKSIPVHERLDERTRFWWQRRKLSYAYYESYPFAKAHQYGGTAIFGIDSASDRYMGSGKDPTGLGRWCWMRFRGNAGMSLRFISAYRPNDSSNEHSVFSQHKWYYQNKGKNPNPRDTILEDLAKEIMAALQAGADCAFH